MIKTPVRVRTDNNNWFSLLDADGHCLARYFCLTEITELARIVNAHVALVEALKAIVANRKTGYESRLLAMSTLRDVRKPKSCSRGHPESRR